jgi:hypothetical protein
MKNISDTVINLRTLNVFYKVIPNELYRKDFVRGSVHEVVRLLLCPSFDFIKNRFKSKSKLKPEAPTQPDEYSKVKGDNDLTAIQILRGTNNPSCLWTKAIGLTLNDSRNGLAKL